MPQRRAESFYQAATQEPPANQTPRGTPEMPPFWWLRVPSLCTWYLLRAPHPNSTPEKAKQASRLVNVQPTVKIICAFTWERRISIQIIQNIIFCTCILPLLPQCYLTKAPLSTYPHKQVTPPCRTCKVWHPMPHIRLHQPPMRMRKEQRDTVSQAGFVLPSPYNSSLSLVYLEIQLPTYYSVPPYLYAPLHKDDTTPLFAHKVRSGMQMPCVIHTSYTHQGSRGVGRRTDR